MGKEDKYVSSVSPEYENIGYEAGFPIENEESGYAYNAFDMSRLNGFQHLLDLASKTEEEIADGAQMNYIWKREGEERGQVIIKMDRSFIHNVKEMAFEMYLDFVNDPAMKEAADFILEARKTDREMSGAFEIQELEDLWNK